jgi:hypothetical protein
MGTPIRGIDVKLGKNPGGNVVARATTDAEGNFALPIVPAGSYILSFEIRKEAEVVMSLKGSIRGSKNRTFSSGVKFATRVAVAPAPIILESDGQNPLTGICETAVVRSKSNISSN